MTDDYYKNCIHGVDLNKEYCIQGQCHAWTKKNRPDLLPKPKAIRGSPDTGLAFYKPQSFNYIFVQEGKEVGKIWWDEELHRLRFQGQVDESVWILMKILQQQFDAWYEEKYG